MGLGMRFLSSVSLADSQMWGHINLMYWRMKAGGGMAGFDNKL